jgi:SAM-dependent methyltransferase
MTGAEAIWSDGYAASGLLIFCGARLSRPSTLGRSESTGVGATLGGPSPRRAEALFGATGTGTVSLLLGDRTAELAGVIADLGGRTVQASGDRDGAESGPSSLSPRVRIGSYARLPFADASFDTVFAPHVSADTGERWAGRDPAAGLARELARVLKPGGRLVLGLTHPGLLAALEAAAALRRSPLRLLLPAGVRHRLRLHRTPRSPFPYGADRLTRLLRAAGFREVAVLEQWPRLGHWDHLTPLAGGTLGRLRHAMRRRGRLPRLVERLGVAPGRLFIAQTAPADAGQTAAAAPVLESILAPGEWDGSTISAPPVVAKGRSIALVSVGDTFYKISLTPEAARRQRVEMEAVARLLESPAASFIVPIVRKGDLGELAFAGSPFVEPMRYADESDRVAAQAEAFRLLGVDARMRPARTTRSWARIFSDPSRSALEGLEAGDLCGYMEREVGGKRVLAGFVHGDLHQKHVMRLAGRTVLIDWDRAERDSPLILDRCNGVFRLLTRRLRATLGDRRYLAALDLMACRDPGVPLLEYIDAAAGELAWPEVMLTHVLSYSSWRLLDTVRGRHAAHREIREQLDFVRNLLS